MHFSSSLHEIAVVHSSHHDWRRDIFFSKLLPAFCSPCIWTHQGAAQLISMILFKATSFSFNYICTPIICTYVWCYIPSSAVFRPTIRLINNKFHGLSPSGGHHSLLFDQGFPNNAWLQHHLSDRNTIWRYFVLMRLYLAMLFILSILLCLNSL